MADGGQTADSAGEKKEGDAGENGEVGC